MAGWVAARKRAEIAGWGRHPRALCHLYRPERVRLRTHGRIVGWYKQAGMAARGVGFFGE